MILKDNLTYTWYNVMYKENRSYSSSRFYPSQNWLHKSRIFKPSQRYINKSMYGNSTHVLKGKKWNGKIDKIK